MRIAVKRLGSVLKKIFACKSFLFLVCHEIVLMGVINNKGNGENNRLFWLMMVAFIGFSGASLFFMRFGSLSWKRYWGISRIVFVIISLLILFKLFSSRSKN